MKKILLTVIGIFVFIFIVFPLFTYRSDTVVTNSSRGRSSTIPVPTITPEDLTLWVANTSETYCKNHTKQPNFPDLSNLEFPDLKFEFKTNAKPDLSKEECEQVVKACYRLWKKNTCEDIANGKIWIGMTVLQTILSIGMPNDRNETVTQFGKQEQWVYGSPLRKAHYLYFEGTGGLDTMKLTSWQNF